MAACNTSSTLEEQLIHNAPGSSQAGFARSRLFFVFRVMQKARSAAELMDNHG